MIPLPLTTTLAFAALTIALVLLWSRRARHAWVAAGAVSIAIAIYGGLIDVRGLIAIAALAALGATARRVANRWLRIVVHALVLMLCAALYLHVVPGFSNPRIITDAILAPDSQPYTKYLNFDKGLAALLLLGLYVPNRTAADEGARHVRGFLWRFAIVVAAVLALTLAFGYVRWDPKVAPWWPAWLYSMVFLTALPEEAIFRGVVLSAIACRLGNTPNATIVAVGAAGVLFGIAHGGGGITYVLLATAAGVGYGWIYASTRSLAASIAAHTGLNTIHFLLFSYPALRVIDRAF